MIDKSKATATFKLEQTNETEEDIDSTCSTLTYSSLISPKFVNSKVAFLISNMIAGAVTSKVSCFKFHREC